ncbi:MAG: GDP-mannose 4,6-dehydratase [Polyangiaceae bacterium]
MNYVLVTGGAGFIASTVADQLLATGASVTALDNFDPYYDPAQKRRNIRAAQVNPRYELVEADVAEADQLERVFARRRPDLVIHLAAKAGVRSSVADPHAYLRTNELGGLNVLDACVRHGNVPLCLASTSSVYGNSTQPPFDEEASAVCPLSPYAASKRASELMAYTFNYLHKLPVAVLRFFTVYGPRGRPDMAVAKFTELLLSGQTIRMHGEETERDFTFVQDIAAGVLGAGRWITENQGFGTFNLGRSEPVRVRRLIELLAAELGVEPNIELGELEPSESKVTSANTARAQAAFGYSPRISLEEGIRAWVHWYRTSDESPRPR